ncbi:hypothetical protein ABQD95_04300 [Enterococcus avium]|nr:hypothetical protein [Enterococcus avium]MDT2390956.1 hypothetical protein [Enterococcus avium]
MNESKEKASSLNVLADRMKATRLGKHPRSLCPHSIKELEELP